VPRHFDHVAASLPFGIGTFWVGKLDDQLVRLDLDPDDVIVNEGCVLDLGRSVEVTSNTFYDEGLDLIRWDSEQFRLVRLALQKSGREVVPVLDAPLSDMARCHLMTAIVVDAAQ
jgi:hypothetical protein